MPVTILDAWLSDGTYDTQDVDFVPSAGTNRLVLICLSAEKNIGGPIAVATVSLGDKVLTELFDFTVGSASAYHNLLWVGYLNDADIAARTGDTITISYDNAPNNPFGEPKIHYASYQDVNQSTPIADSSSAIDTSASTLAPGNVSVGEGDKNIVFFVLGQPSFPSPAAGYTEESEEVGVTNDHSSSANHRTATSASTENPVMVASSATRLAVAAAVLLFATAAPASAQTHQMML